MHALIENNIITAIRDAPAGGAWEDGQWLDFTDPEVLSEWEARHGWVPVVETPRPANHEAYSEIAWVTDHQWPTTLPGTPA